MLTDTRVIPLNLLNLSTPETETDRQAGQMSGSRCALRGLGCQSDASSDTIQSNKGSCETILQQQQASAAVGAHTRVFCAIGSLHC